MSEPPIFDLRTIENMQQDIDELTDSRDEMRTQLAALANAFPNGDFSGHRQWHELKIAEIQEIKKLRIALTERVAGSLLNALIFFVLLAIGWYVVHLVRGPTP